MILKCKTFILWSATSGTVIVVILVHDFIIDWHSNLIRHAANVHMIPLVWIVWNILCWWMIGKLGDVWNLKTDTTILLDMPNKFKISDENIFEHKIVFNRVYSRLGRWRIPPSSRIHASPVIRKRTSCKCNPVRGQELAIHKKKVACESLGNKNLRVFVCDTRTSLLRKTGQVIVIVCWYLYYFELVGAWIARCRKLLPGHSTYHERQKYSRL